MKKLTLCAMAAAMVMTGCANLQQGQPSDAKTKSAAGGALIGCLGGAILAKLTNGNAAQGCVAGAVIGGLVGFEKARQDEIAAAETARRDALAALATLPKGPVTPVASEVKTVEVTATDKTTKETKKYKAFDSVTVDIPLSAKGTPEHDAAMAKLKTLATRVADERGSSQIIVAMQPGDVKLQKMDLMTASVKTTAGNVITVNKVADETVPKGVERVTVKAGNLRTDV